VALQTHWTFPVARRLFCYWQNVARIWSIAHLTKCAAPLISLSIEQYLMYYCAVFGQSCSALGIGLELRLGLGLGFGLALGLILVLE